MSAACGCEHDEPETAVGEEAEEAERPGWRDGGIMVPVFSGVAFLTRKRQPKPQQPKRNQGPQR